MRGRLLSLLFSTILLLGVMVIAVSAALAQPHSLPDTVQNFPLTISPRGVTFDGTNIWVTTLSSNNVTKLGGDGTVLGTFPAGGPTIYGTFDGTNIWVTNVLQNTASKIRVSHGQLLGSFRVGRTPAGITFDGANIWVANNGTRTVTELRASDGTVVGTFNIGQGSLSIDLRWGQYLGD